MNGKRLSCALGVIVLAAAGAFPALADYRAGREAYQRGDYAVALAEWEEGAQQGDADSMAGLGRIWERGDNGRQDYGRAINYYEQAAKKGSAEAKYRLAVLSMMPKDSGGRGNLLEAYMWADLARADAGSTGAMATDLVNSLKGQLTIEQQAAAIRKATAWRREREEENRPKPEPKPEPPAPVQPAPPVQPPGGGAAYPPQNYAAPAAPYPPYGQPAYPAPPSQQGWIPGLPPGVQPGAPLPGFPGQPAGAQAAPGFPGAPPGMAGMPGMAAPGFGAPAAAAPVQVDIAAAQAQLESRSSCATMPVKRGADGRLTVSGAAISPAELGELKRLAAQAAPGAAFDATVVSKPLCDALQALAPLRRRNDAAGGGLAIRPLQANGRPGDGQLRENDSLVVQIDGGDADSHVQVLYFMLDGQLLRLAPGQQEPDDFLPGRGKRVLGQSGESRRSWTIGEPFGREALVVIASPRPILFDSARPESEPALTYLSELTAALARQPAGEKTMAAIAFISTRARR